MTVLAIWLVEQPSIVLELFDKVALSLALLSLSIHGHILAHHEPALTQNQISPSVGVNTNLFNHRDKHKRKAKRKKESHNPNTTDREQ